MQIYNRNKEILIMTKKVVLSSTEDLNIAGKIRSMITHVREPIVGKL